MKNQGEAPAQHLRQTDGKIGYVEVTPDGFHVHLRRKCTGKTFATWDGMPITWHGNVGSNKAANR